ncbi:hypothetical protein [Hymenobacter arizonensis]|uniref:Uncharacterized protein n=1 Tax=Hymenobacter arizonensis TaxID=1227077 RepID=A0A1I6BNK8_HYMAR|nr:hypothetical protein [Hymenobacter arizonensis]SFQ82464.1 hypothetical protein SAMN04515668_4819 [Hymenobacter arizonensis]
MRPLLTALLLLTACAAVRAQEFDSAADKAALLREVEILKQGVAQRKPGEADTAFLQRLFPASFEHEKAIRYAWRPSAHGPQLFFSRAQRDELHTEGEGTELFVLDPFQPGRYAVQVLFLEPIGDITNLAAFFFADVNQDGQKELLALVYAEVQRVVLLNVGPGKKERAVGRFSHWQTQVFRYRGRNAAGLPRYEPDQTSRPYLNGLRSAAAVRQALAQHQQQPKRPPGKAVK